MMLIVQIELEACAMMHNLYVNNASMKSSSPTHKRNETRIVFEYRKSGKVVVNVLAENAVFRVLFGACGQLLIDVFHG